MRGCPHTYLYRAAVPPNQPKTPKRSVRVPEELWRAVLVKAHKRGETVTEVVIRALKRYLRD